MPLPDPQDETCCLPGDILVNAMPSGFFVGRTLPKGRGRPEVEFVAVLSSFADAVTRARKEALRHTSRAWIQHDGNHYYRIPDNPDDPLGFDDDGRILH